jgi:hypothetical protein
VKGPIRLIDAQRYHKGLPHQNAAWEWLQNELTDQQLSDFAALFRSGPRVSSSAINKIENDWEGICIAAERAGSIYPELVAAMWALESGYGKHFQRQTNNPFGLKALPTQSGVALGTEEVIAGRVVQITDRFLTFESLNDSVVYLVDRWFKDFTVNGKTFTGANSRPSIEEAAWHIQIEGYSTHPEYAKRLLQIVEENDGKDLDPSAGVGAKNPLDVPYLAQYDSTIPGQAQRMCFSSSCAMLVKALQPQCLGNGDEADDDYLRIVHEFGDTTDPSAQLRALRRCRIDARFTQEADWDLIKLKLRQGKPVPMGILHQGHLNNGGPSGNGHWIIAIGLNETRRKTNGGPGLIVHDPWGDLDLVSGQYLSKQGKRLTYSFKNLAPRWMVEGPGSGWAIIPD